MQASTLSFMIGLAKCSPVFRKCFISLKIQGFPIDPLPIIAPSKPNSSLIKVAFSGESISPFPKTGIFILGFSFTCFIKVQSASPLYICFLVLPCIEMACIPTSCNRSATSTMYFVFSSQPSRVLTVTGMLVDFTICLVISTILGISLSIPAPAPLFATFFTGHP